MSQESAIVVCETCGFPARVTFEDGDIVRVAAPCGHVKMPEPACEENCEDRNMLCSCGRCACIGCICADGVPNEGSQS